jgi:hypothetical protein
VANKYYITRAILYTLRRVFGANIKSGHRNATKYYIRGTTYTYDITKICTFIQPKEEDAPPSPDGLMTGCIRLYGPFIDRSHCLVSIVGFLQNEKMPRQHPLVPPPFPQGLMFSLFTQVQWECCLYIYN